MGGRLRLVECPCSLPYEIAGVFEPDRAIGDDRADRRVLNDVPAALHPELPVLDGGFECGTPEPEIYGSRIECGARAERRLNSATRLAGDHVRLRNVAILELDATAGAMLPTRHAAAL